MPEQKSETGIPIRVARLDGDYSHLRVRADNDVELNWRAQATKKEPETVEWIESFDKSDLFLDIGANVGSYSLIAASRGNTVISIEPHPPTYGHLVDNIRNNKFQDIIHPLCIATSSSNGVKRMHESKPDPGSAGHVFDALDGRYTLGLTLDTLMDLNLPQPDHIKVDTDGHEWEVVQGMEMALKEAKSVLVEVDYHYSLAQKIIDFMEGKGFTGKEVPHKGEISNWIFRRK